MSEQKQSSAPIMKVVYAVLFLLLFVLCGLGAYIYLLPPPQILGSNLVLGQVQKIDVNSPLKISFSRWMNHSSVEAAFHITPAKAGAIHWENNTLVFVPAQGTWESTKQYQVWIDPSASDFFHKKIAENFYQQFEISGPPKVIMNLPQGVVSEEKTPLTIVFDRPMVAATTLEASNNFAVPIEIVPTISGKYKWIGTNTLQFSPEQWNPATTYRVTVKKAFQDIYGLSLATDFSWQFDTAHPQVLYSYPAVNYEKAGPHTEVTIRFNQAVDQRSLEQNVDWEIADTKQKVSFALRLEEEGTKVILTPQQSLPYTTKFITTVHKGLKSQKGVFALSEDYVLPFSTVGLPLVESTTPKDGEKNAPRYGISINFTNPMSADDIDQFIKVEPRIENQLNDLSEYNEHQVLTISGDFLPSTHYQITLSQNWQDQYGQKMPYDFGFKFDTAAVVPDLAFIGRQEFGLIDGYSPKYEQVLQAINLNKIHISLEKVDLAKIWSLLKRESIGTGTVKQTWDVESPNPLNQVVQIPVDITNKAQSSGVYVMRAKSDDISQYDIHQAFLISKTSLTFKAYPNGGLVWATDLKSGEPVQGVAISILKGPRDALLQGITDQDGLFSFNWPANFPPQENGYYQMPSLLVVGQKGDDLALTANDYSWSQGIEPWNFNISQTSTSETIRAFLTTDRPLYQPGQQVFFKAILRQAEDTEYKLINNATKTKVVVINAEGEQIWTKELATDEHGTIGDTFTLPATAPLGNYSIDVAINEQHFFTNFIVQQYQKPLFKVDIQTDKDEYTRDETMNVKAQANYYFGMPLAQAKVTYRVYADDYFFYSNQYGQYNFTDMQNDCFYCMPSGQVGKPWVEKTVTTDSQGNMSFSVPTTFTTEKESQSVTIEIGVQDPNTKEMIYATKQVVVHKGEFYLGVANQSYVVQKKDNAIFQIVSLSPHNTVRGNINGQAQLFKREFKTIKKRGVDGFFYYDNSSTDTLIKTAAFATSNDGKTQVAFSIPDAGQYHVVVSASDSKGHLVTAATDIWASSDTYINWGRDNNNMMDIIPDKSEYAIGDVAKLLVKSPYENVKALLTIERNGVLEKKIITIPTTASTIEIPLKNEYLPNVFVSIVAVKGYGKDNTPGFKLGYINLRLNNQARKLTMSLTPDQTTYTPQSVVTVNMVVKDANGKPVAGDFGVAVVDQGLLALSGKRDDDLLERFFGQRSLAVSTYQSLVTLIQRIDVKKGGGAKGGGGGENLAQRKNFKDTAYFNPHVVTNQDGTATIKFTLPDNTTTWQIWAFGATDDTNVGSASINVVARKDIFIDPLLPRFFTTQDQVKVGAAIHNTSNQIMKANVKLDTTNMSITSTVAQDIQIAPQSTQTVYWNTVVGDVSGEAKLIFTLQSAIGQDSVEKVIPVEEWITKEANAFGGVVREHADGGEKLVLPVGFVPESVNASLKITTSLSDTITPFVKKMMLVPYNSADIIAGKLFITVMPETKAKIPLAFAKNTAGDLLQRLYTYQQNDGGFSYFPGNLQSDPYLSAYVLFSLNKAANNKFTVDTNVLANVKAYLIQYLNAANTDLSADIEKKYSGIAREDAHERINEILNTKAYIAFVLSESGEKNIAMQNLYEHQADLSLVAQAYVAMTAQTLGKGDVAIQLVNNLKNKIIKTATLAHFEEEKALYTQDANAMYLNTVLLNLFMRTPTLDNSTVMGDLIRYVLTKHTDTWADPFADTSYIWSAIQWDRLNTSSSGMWNVTFNGRDLASGNNNTDIVIPTLDIKAAGEENVLQIKKTGPGVVYYAGTLEYTRPASDSSPMTEGLSINREYFALDDKEQQHPLQSFSSGQDVVVNLTVIVPHDQDLVIVEDALPAGLSAQNFAFQTTSPWQQKLLDEINSLHLDRELLGETIQPWAWSYQEIQDDRVVTYAETLTKGVYQFSYIAKAGVAGKYNVRPARAYAEHTPDIFGTSEARKITVTP